MSNRLLRCVQVHAVSGAHAVAARLITVGGYKTTLESWRRVGGAWVRLPDLPWGEDTGSAGNVDTIDFLLALPGGSALVAGRHDVFIGEDKYASVGPFRLE